MRKIIYVLVVVSIAIVNTVFTIRKFGCGIPEKVIVAYDSDNNPIFAEIIREGELGECEGKTGSCSPYPCTRRWPF